MPGLAGMSPPDHMGMCNSEVSLNTSLCSPVLSLHSARVAHAVTVYPRVAVRASRPGTEVSDSIRLIAGSPFLLTTCGMWVVVMLPLASTCTLTFDLGSILLPFVALCRTLNTSNVGTLHSSRAHYRGGWYLFTLFSIGGRLFLLYMSFKSVGLRTL